MAGHPSGARGDLAPQPGSDVPVRGRQGHRVLLGGRSEPGSGEQQGGTRERILDVALDLFVEQGFYKTSLREIADRLGVTKAALYYHFPSKADILIALHMRMHELIRRHIGLVTGVTASRQHWLTFMDALVDSIVGNSKLFLLHQRNSAALAELHLKDHGGPETEPDQIFRGILDDPSLSLDDRVRVAGSLAVVMAGATMLLGAGGAEVTGPEALADSLRRAVHDLMGAGAPASETARAAPG